MKWAFAFLIVLAGLISSPVFAKSQAGCPDSKLITGSKIVSAFCYECILPIKVMGAVVPLGGRGARYAPSMTGLDTAGPICVCPGSVGIPAVGVSFGAWFPDNIHEVNGTPWCFPTFGLNLGGKGAVAKILSATQQGRQSAGSESNTGQGDNGGFYNFHMFKFPAAVIMEFLTSTRCAPKVAFDLDMAYISEIDPTWRNELMMIWTYPEQSIFANVAAEAACMADTVMAAVHKPLTMLHWCQGSMGRTYGNGIGQDDSTFEAQMRTNGRALTALHRRSLLMKTSGQSAVCKGHPWFVLPKGQYQAQNLWPRAQRSAQWLGTTELKRGWGVGRAIPVAGEDRVLMEWQFKECCITAW